MILFIYVYKNQVTEPAPQYVFLYAENQGEDYPTTQGAYKFAELVAQETEGRIKILVKSEGKLGDESSVIKQIRFGGIDFARVSLSQLAETIPEYTILEMPYLYEDGAHMWQVLESPLGREFLDQAKDYGMVGLSWYDAGARSFYNGVRPVHSPQDMTGMKIRVQDSRLMQDLVLALGAVPIPMAYEDVYSGLERGLIEGAENNWPSYEAMGHDEQAKYFTVDEHMRVPEIQICSEVTWQQLSAQDQVILRRCAHESSLYERHLWIEEEKQARQQAQNNGTLIITLSANEKVAFKEAVEGIYEKYCGQEMEMVQKIQDMTSP